MKISTLAAAALFGAGLSFMAPGADAMPLDSTPDASATSQAVTADKVVENTAIIAHKLVSHSVSKPSI